MAQGPLLANVAKNAAGLAQYLSLGVQGDASVSELHGRKYLQTYAKNVFVGANSTGVTTSAALATTYVGLVLSNPAANTKNLVVRTVGGGVIVAPAGVLQFGLIVGYVAAGVVTHTTALTPLSGFVGSTTVATTAKLDSAATIVGTPAWARFLAVNSASAGLFSFSVDLEGAIILPPGAYAAIGTNVAGPAAGFLGSFEWEEVPV